MSKKRSILIILAIIMISLPFFCHSQAEGKCRMKGAIKDQDGNPLPGVTVKLYSFRADAGFDTKSDKNGIWKAMWIRSGKWNLDFEKAGYEPKKLTTNLKASSKIVEIPLSMKKLAGMVLKKDLMKDFEKGNKLFSEKKYDNALTVYTHILQEFPDSYIINLNVGNCYFEKQEYEKAVAAYQKVLEKEPDNTKAMITIGNSYSNMNQPEKALAWYKKIDVAKIDDPVVLYNIGIFHFNANNLQGAVDFLKRSTELKEDFLDGWYQLGMAYMGTGDNAAAIKSFETYLSHDKESETAKQVEEILKALKAPGGRE